MPGNHKCPSTGSDAIVTTTEGLGQTPARIRRPCEDVTCMLSPVIAASVGSLSETGRPDASSNPDLCSGGIRDAEVISPSRR
jgi:hypothetical protein